MGACGLATNKKLKRRNYNSSINYTMEPFDNPVLNDVNKLNNKIIKFILKSKISRKNNIDINTKIIFVENVIFFNIFFEFSK